MSQPHPARLIRVSAPSRLHFGLWGFGRTDARQFGGVGVMVAAPRVELRLRPAAAFRSTGLLAERVAESARCWARFYGHAGDLPCQMDLVASPPAHAGLGVGTQVGLAVAAALNAFFARPMPAPAELALSVGRGRRSAVGTYGFVHGGLAVERGRTPEELFSPLESRWALPETWRFVLLQPRSGAGLAGAGEQQAFDRLPPVPAYVTERLVEEVRARMLPALAQARFAEFSESVFQYGRLAGVCFAAYQGGPYNGHRLSELVDLVRSMGVVGVGQSSWGPTLFALLPSDDGARDFVSRVRQAVPDDELTLTVTAADNRGATVEVRFAGEAA